MKVKIELEGCDGTTEMVYWLDESQLAFARDLEKQSHENSSYSCEPVLNLIEDYEGD